MAVSLIQEGSRAASARVVFPMKPAVPRYLEYSAFGALAKREHPGVFSGEEDGGIAQLLPQRLIPRSPALAAGGIGRYAPPVVDIGDEESQFIASAPFPASCCVVYFEAEVEVVDESTEIGEVSVNLGFEKRNLGPRPAEVDSHAYEQSSEEFDDTSDIEEEMSASSNANVSLSASWAGSAAASATDDSPESIEDNRLIPHGPRAVLKTLDRAAIVNWVWKLNSGELWSTGTKGTAPQLSEPLSGPLKRPLRLGLGIDLMTGKLILTRNGRAVAQYKDTANMAKSQSRVSPSDIVLVPTLAVRNARVRPIFGNGHLPNDGFEYDISAHAYRNFRLGLTAEQVFQKKARDMMLNLVIEYFAFYGYAESVAVYQRDFTDPVPMPSPQSIALRQQVRMHIRDGSVDRVCHLLNEAGLRAVSPELQFKLDFHAFVQLVQRASTSEDIEHVLIEGRNLFDLYKAAENPEVRACLEQASGLLVSKNRQNAAQLEELCGSEAIHKLTTAVMSAISEAEGRPVLPQLIFRFSARCNELGSLARRGNGEASAMLGELIRQLGWSWYAS